MRRAHSKPGDVAGFPAGSENGHHFINDAAAPARLLVVGSRDLEDDAFYSDIDMQILKRARGGSYTRRNGERY